MRKLVSMLVLCLMFLVPVANAETLQGFVQRMDGSSQYMSFAALERQIVLGAPGDPLYGQLVPGATTLKWNEMSQTQLYAWIYCRIIGNSPPNSLPPDASVAQCKDLTKAMLTMLGVQKPANWGYTQWEKFLGFPLVQVQ